MMKNITLTLVVYLMVTSLCHSQKLNDSIVMELRKGVKGFAERYHTPGILVVIVHDRDIIFQEAQGYIDIEKKIPATMDSRFPVLSVTKTFTATMLMQLYERNKLSFHDDVKNFVPEYRQGSAQPDKDSTTLFQLATHTSGLPRNSQADIHFTKQVDRWILAGKNYVSLEPASKAEFLRSLKFVEKQYPEYELLSYNDRHYSNLGYSLLGIALGRAAGTDYAEYIIKNICKPLQMKNTGFDTENYGSDHLAKGYYYDEKNERFLKTPVFHSNSALYAGGMYSTATDLAKYIAFHFRDDPEANGILSAKSRRMMQSLRIGWKPSYPFVLHEGSMLGYRCQVTFNPELKIGWLVLTNTSHFEFSRMNEYFSSLVLPVYNTESDKGLGKYAGTYELKGGYDSLEIYIKNGNLHSTYLQDELGVAAMVPSRKDQFKSHENGRYSILYHFIPNEAGEMRYLNMGQLMWVKK